MSEYSELEIERRNQIYRDTYIVPFVLRLRKFSRYDKLRKYYRNKVSAWKSRQRKLAKARRPESLARRRRLYRGIKSMTEEHNPPMKAHGLRRSPQTLRRETEALRRWKLRKANQPPPSQRDEAAESQLPEAPTRRRRLCRDAHTSPAISNVATGTQRSDASLEVRTSSSTGFHSRR
ncbi:hypothetical protein BHYA_0277g00100 [Botrytis hyacinthi]|uniref:BZIP domain-containing protein n=1 Tax=Botrytis hyacinthi TaxID=278943 RepID=A0A4Z1GBX6_9HELO|nr:hypothetical protein BHYA_0277g00100 [Botrytis hyacinthi]